MRAAPQGGRPFLSLRLDQAQLCDAEASDGIDGIDAIDPINTINTINTVNTVNAAPLPQLRGADAPPLRRPARDGEENALGCIGKEEDQYSLRGWDACWRVLISNPPSGDAARRTRVRELRKESLLGPAGHVERANAWTHLIGAVGFFIYALVRPWVLDATSLSGRLASYASAVLVVTFGVSTAFHAGSPVRRWAALLRMFDHGAIDVALGVAAVADASVVTLDFRDVPWQAMVDAIGVAVVILLFFAYRRAVLPSKDTEIAWGDCILGLFRFQHADFEFGALRSAGYICLSFSFILLIPVALQNLSGEAAYVLVFCNGASLGLLIIGLLIDNMLVWPDVLYRRGKMPPLQCHSKECGCIMTSHAFWHVFSLFSVVILTVGREFAIADTDFHPQSAHV